MNRIKILLVEDNPADVDLIRENLLDLKILVDLFVCRDGFEAEGFLNRTGQYKDSPRPDLILLDLNLPKKDGRELLADIKQDDQLRIIPVVVLTSSLADQDVLQSYNLQASAYVAKPLDLNEFSRIVTAVEGFWFSVVVYPPEAS